MTDVWWAVQFPYAEGFRHPVTLYEGAKNLVVLGILLYVRRRTMPGRGLLLAHFVFWYGFLRIFADLYREYGVEFLGIGRGQYYNLFMALLGLILWFVFARRAPAASATTSLEPQPDPPATLLWPQRLVFAALVTLALTIPSGWSKDWLAEHRPPPLAAVDAADALR